MATPLLDEGLQTVTEEDITVTGTATRLTAANVYSSPPPRQVEMFVETAQLRWRSDGTAPTASVGEIANPFDRLTLRNLNDILNFQAIRTGGTSANLHVRYRR